MSEGAEGYGSEGYGVEESSGGQQGQGQDISGQLTQLAEQVATLSQWANHTTDYINGRGQQQQEPWAEPINELRQGIQDIVTLLGNNNKAWQGQVYQQQIMQQQQQQMEYERNVQGVGQYATQMCGAVDQQLTEEGYDGFSENRALVQSEIVNSIPWSRDPQTFYQQITLANDPTFWGLVYREHVAPKLAAFNSTFRRTENTRASLASNNDTWDNNDYMTMRQQYELGRVIE